MADGIFFLGTRDVDIDKSLVSKTKTMVLRRETLKFGIKQTDSGQISTV